MRGSPSWSYSIRGYLSDQQVINSMGLSSHINKADSVLSPVKSPSIALEIVQFRKSDAGNCGFCVNSDAGYEASEAYCTPSDCMALVSAWIVPPKGILRGDMAAIWDFNNWLEHGNEPQDMEDINDLWEALHGNGMGNYTYELKGDKVMIKGPGENVFMFDPSTLSKIAPLMDRFRTEPGMDFHASLVLQRALNKND